ncbi:MAG: GntR family transcriptional regulator [Muribaculaceae bacterium]|nr:GntR family transcriptional regulator [Muribaculaceae bacterium]
MDFKTNKPIYQQIIDYCFNKILAQEWVEEGKVPSVRELAMELSVNSHTVLKAYEYLQNEDIIYAKRGLGFFLATDATAHVNNVRREEFYETTLSELFNEMDRLQISIDDIVAHYNNRK